jgi:hypothetical protein
MIVPLQEVPADQTTMAQRKSAQVAYHWLICVARLACTPVDLCQRPCDRRGRIGYPASLSRRLRAARELAVPHSSRDLGQGGRTESCLRWVDALGQSYQPGRGAGQGACGDHTAAETSAANVLPIVSRFRLPTSSAYRPSPHCGIAYVIEIKECCPMRSVRSPQRCCRAAVMSVSRAMPTRRRRARRGYISWGAVLLRWPRQDLRKNDFT